MRAHTIFYILDLQGLSIAILLNPVVDFPMLFKFYLSNRFNAIGHSLLLDSPSLHLSSVVSWFYL